MKIDFFAVTFQTYMRLNRLMRQLFLLLILASCNVLQAQNYYLLRGYVYNESNDPLPAVYVRVQNTGSGTSTNEKGQYELRLHEGLNRIVYSFVGFQTQTLDVVMNEDKVQHIWLKFDDAQISTVEVRHKRKDLSYEIMEKLIDNKWKYQNQYQSSKHHIYIKSIEEIEKKHKEKKPDDEPEEMPELETKAKDSIPNMHLFEAKLIKYFEQPDKHKEEKTAVKKIADQSTLFYTSTTDAYFNFMDNLLLIRKLGDNSYVSPLNSNTAFLSYKFKLLESYYIGLQKIYRIEVIPRKMGNALFKGELEVYDSLWALKSVKFELPKNSLIIYDAFEIEQQFEFIDSILFITKEEFRWKIKNNRGVNQGYCIVKHSEFVIDTTYHKRFFNAELGFTADDAYDKDSSYWETIRPEPLTKKEQDFIRYQDSIYSHTHSEAYLDSIDSVYNRLNWQKLLYRGFGFINRDKKTNWYFDPAVNMLDPVAIGGWRIRYSFSYYKKYENRKSILISPFFNFGFLNKDIKGSIYINYLYNPKKISRISLSSGRYFDLVNNSATIADIIRRSNFYERTFLTLNHSTELFNGFYLGTGINYAIRRDLSDFKFSSLGDSLFENNLPAVFAASGNFQTSVSLSYTPRQLYLSEPNEKIVLGSNFPTFTLYMNKAWDNFEGFDNKFSYGEFSIHQLFNIGILGTSEYKISIGKFFDTTKLSVMDYKYQRGGDLWLFTPAMYTFQLIENTFPTFNWFFESHYVHQFNGFLSSKIPVIKQSGIRGMGGGGFLYAPERNYQYSELYFGINRIFKIGRERLRIGVYHVIAQSNAFGFRNGFKFSIEFYDQDRNTWSF